MDKDTLLLVVIMEVTGARRKRQRDEVPKHPLGLDS